MVSPHEGMPREAQSGQYPSFRQCVLLGAQARPHCIARRWQDASGGQKGRLGLTALNADTSCS
jgi:hypothetical protein